MQQMEHTSFVKRHTPQIVLILTILLTYGWYYNGANANQASRYDVVFSFCEPGTPDYLTFRIDRFVGPNGNTCDWARRQGGKHLYSNKPPGVSIACIPFYFALYRAERQVGILPNTPAATYINCYLLNLWATVLPVAISAIFFHAFLLRDICPGRRLLAWWLTIILYFGTLAFPFSTQLWGHPTAMALIIVALYFYDHPDRRAQVAAGAAAGGAVLCDYSAGIVVAALALRSVVQMDWKKFALYCAGGIPMFAIYATYHQMCFGTPLLPATVFNNPLFHTKDAAAGMFQVSEIGRATWGLTFSPYRGLFWYMPILTLVPIAGVLALTLVINTLFRFAQHGIAAPHQAPFAPLRVPAELPGLLCNRWLWISTGCILLFFVMNISFNGWHGGWSTGPRYLIPSLPFHVVIIGIGIHSFLPRYQKLSKHLRRAALLPVVLLAGISVANMMTITSVSPMAQNLGPETTGSIRELAHNPLYYYYKTIVKLGIIQPLGRCLFPMRGEPQEEAVRHNIFTLGRLLGLRGRTQILPPLLIMITGIVSGALLNLQPHAGSTPEPSSGYQVPAQGEREDSQS